METEQFSDKEELLEKHRKERKELQNKIQSLKKSANKDKKKKKEITETIAQMEKELNDRHQYELGNLPDLNNEENGEATDQDETSTQELNSVRVSRAQKRRLKKEAETKEREKRIAEEEENNENCPRKNELNLIKKILQDEGLELHEIPADGNCLYCAINHQLEVTGRTAFNVTKLRKMTANFMRENKDEFIPFMHEEDFDGDMLGDEQFEKYCKSVANTKLWGGQLELTALSNILKCPIKVIQTTGAHLQGENHEGPALTLTYHKHLYRLGEHYNSTVQLNSEKLEDSKDNTSP